MAASISERTRRAREEYEMQQARIRRCYGRAVYPAGGSTDQREVWDRGGVVEGRATRVKGTEQRLMVRGAATILDVDGEIVVVPGESRMGSVRLPQFQFIMPGLASIAREAMNVDKKRRIADVRRQIEEEEGVGKKG